MGLLLRSRLARALVFWPVLAAVVVGAWYVVSYVSWRYQYPYGWSHCCDIGLDHLLETYARSHGGHFPAGESSPEASLSLLARTVWSDPEMWSSAPELLRGKTVPASVVKEILDRGELLGPDTCGWHYVEGLTLTDDRRIAMFWDKVGLDHNGGRLPNGGYNVMFLGGSRQVIPAEEWPEFEKQQKQLFASRKESPVTAIPFLSAKVRLPSGEVTDSFDATCWIVYRASKEAELNSESVTRGKMRPRALQWWNTGDFGLAGANQGMLTLTLQLSNQDSKPVEIKVSNGTASPNIIVFDMMPNDGK